MNDFRTIYRMLKTLQKAMDYDEGADPDSLSAQALGISSNRLKTLWHMLSQEGFVTRATIGSYQTGCAGIKWFDRTTITIKGLEYLCESPLMKKAALAEKGIVAEQSY